MYKEIAKLILYRDLGEDSILLKLSGIFRDYELDLAEKEELTSRIYEQMKALLDLSTQYGFDKNLWHNYLTFILLTNENSFSMTSEKVGANDGTVNHFAKADFAVFKKLFDFDLVPLRKSLASTVSLLSAITTPFQKRNGCTTAMSVNVCRKSANNREGQ